MNDHPVLARASELVRLIYDEREESFVVFCNGYMGRAVVVDTPPEEWRSNPGAAVVAVFPFPGRDSIQYFEGELRGEKTMRQFPEPFGTEGRRRQDIRMMKNREFWPLSLLPLKKPGTFETAVWDGEALLTGPGVNVFLPETLAHATRQEMTPEEVVSEGWTVD